MPKLLVPNNASIHTARDFLTKNNPYNVDSMPGILVLHPRWAHVDPFALSIIAAWGGWCKRHDIKVSVENIGKHADYAARMRLFQHLAVDYTPSLIEHEEAGRFLPLTQVQGDGQLKAVIADVSAILHLEEEPDALAAVQYCVSELIRNVLEHSGSQEGAYVCAHRYVGKGPRRVTIAVADCGAGIAAHLGTVYPDALQNSRIALGLAMRPGVTGARKGMYGRASENAGAGLFITRSIAKGTGGYFLLLSGDAGYRLKRARKKREDEQAKLYFDAFDEPRHDFWELPSTWVGTAVAVEIRTDKIEDFQAFFQWIRSQLPARRKISKEIKFT